MDISRNISIKKDIISKGIQPKLSINAPGDKYEQEADAMADKVMRMPANGTDFTPKTGIIGASIQRKCAACEEEEKQRKIMRKETGGLGGMAVSNTFSSTLNATIGGGTSMPQSTRGFMENAFSTDFSNVRIHNDSQANQLSQSIHAKAFTNGNDIYFGAGQYAPNSNSGKSLLAHELMHTLQQGNDILKRSAKFNTGTKTNNINIAEQFIKGINNNPDSELGSTHPLINQIDLTSTSNNPLNIPTVSDFSTNKVGETFETKVTTIPSNETSFNMRLPQKVAKWIKNTPISAIPTVFQRRNCQNSNTSIEVVGINPNSAGVVSKTEIHEDVHATHIEECHHDYVEKFDNFLNNHKTKSSSLAQSQKIHLSTITGMATAMKSGFGASFTAKADAFHALPAGKKANLNIVNIPPNCSKVEIEVSN